MNSAALSTQRNINSSWFIFFSSLLGSVFGILGSYAYVMTLVEGFTSKVKKKYKKRQKFNAVDFSRTKISEVFSLDTPCIKKISAVDVSRKEISEVFSLDTPCTKKISAVDVSRKEISEVFSLDTPCTKKISVLDLTAIIPVNN